jgi:dihydrofolate reductase
MGALHVHEFMSLDSVIDAPTWTVEFGFDPRMGDAIAASMQGCTAILLGRTTFEMFEPAWSTRTEADDPGAPFFNDTVKHVVSSTLTNPTWRNSTVIGPYNPAAIRELKTHGDVYTSGSGTLVRAMLADGLVDHLHLFVYPVTRGSGPRLFPDTAAPSNFTVAASEMYDNGVSYLNLQPKTTPTARRQQI